MTLPRKAISLAILFILCFISYAPANTGKVETQIIPELKAYRANPHPPVIDGRLDDSIWGNPHLEKGRLLIRRTPDEGMPATESTLVAVAYDDDALYVAFWCYDSQPDKISRQLVRRDREAQSDFVTVRVDPFHDHQNGNAFETSAAGVQRDCRYFNECSSDMAWDGVWESAVAAQPWGWSSEFRIPYYCLRFAEKDEHTWGMDFIRFINRKNEKTGWAFTPSSKGGFVSNFGHLTNLRNIKPAGHLELLPYVVSSEETEPKRPGNTDGRDFLKNAGFDVKYGMATDLTLDATINPDFGQVELDEPVLNLSAYETFLSERRPFFLEGSDLFATDFNLFYSRRIGRPPRGAITDPEYLYSADFPRATTILGAAKLTGKLFPRTTIALLNAVTQEEKAEYAALTNVVLDSTWTGDTLHTTIKSADTVLREAVVEPAANYSILRIKQELFRNSSVGAIMTLAGQESYHPATTGGIDWRLYSNDNKWGFNGQVVFSRVDNQHTGYGIDATFEKASGKHILGAAGFTIKDRFLNINRLGYTSRSDMKYVWVWVQYATRDKSWIIRESYTNFNSYSKWNFDGINILLGGDINTEIIFANYWYLGGGVEIEGEKYDDMETRGNGLWEWPVRPTLAWWLSLTTDQRKRIYFNWNPGSGSDRGGTWWANYVGFCLRPRSNMELSAGVNYKSSSNAVRWIDNQDNKSLFADLDNNELYFEASASMLINRNLSIQLSAEGLASGLDYSRHRYYLGGNKYSEVIPDSDTYDYNYSEMNSTLLIRWEYRPGSTLYLVWTRSRPDYDPSVDNLDVSRDIKRMFSGDARNILLAKASYWMNI